MTPVARVKRLWPVQARLQLTQRTAGYGVAPIGGDHRGRGKHEVALAHCWMGDREVSVGPYPAGPQDDIEIQNPCRPALSTPFATEMCFDEVQLFEQRGWIEWGCDNGSGICVGPSGWTKRGAGYDRGPLEDVDLGHFERDQRFLDDASWHADQRVALV